MSLYQYFSPDVKLDPFGVLSSKVPSVTIIAPYHRSTCICGPTMLPRCWTKQPFYWPHPNLISLRWGYKLILFINNSFTKFNPCEKEFKSQSSKIYTRGRFNVYGMSWISLNCVLFCGNDFTSHHCCTVLVAKKI